MILKQNQIDQVVSLLQAKVPSLRAVYLFGSGVTDTYSEESDVDLAALAEDTIGNKLIWDLKYELAELLKREVDLVDLKDASMVLKMQVVSAGIRVYEADYQAAEAWDSLVYSMYLTFNDDRKEILEKVAQTGRIYG